MLLCLSIPLPDFGCEASKFWVLGADKTGMGRSGVEGKLL